MKRSVLAVVAGLVTTMIVIAIFDAMNFGLFPPPDHLDPTDKEDLGEIVRLAPVAAWLLLLAGHIIGSLAGGFVVGKVNSGTNQIAAIACGAVMIVFASVNNVSVGSTPVWYWILDLAVYIPFFLIGYKLSFSSKPKLKSDK